MKMNDKTYQFIKWLVLIAMPALSTLVAVLAKGYGWQVDNIVLTINALAVFLGTITGISNYNYKKDDDKK